MFRNNLYSCSKTTLYGGAQFQWPSSPPKQMFRIKNKREAMPSGGYESVAAEEARVLDRNTSCLACVVSVVSCVTSIVAIGSIVYSLRL